MSEGLARDPAAKAAFVARELKQRLVGHPIKGNELDPTLIVFRGGEPVAICNLRRCWADRHNVLRDSVAVLAPDEVVLVVETFVSFTPNVKLGDDDLSERFRDGDPTVSRAIDVLRMTPSGNGEQVLFTYSYVGDTVVWSETPHLGPPVPPPTTKLEGDIADSLIAGFAAAGEPEELEDARTALESLGVWVMFVADAEAFLDVGPDDLCRCGSKRKFKDCHGY